MSAFEKAAQQHTLVLERRAAEDRRIIAILAAEKALIAEAIRPERLKQGRGAKLIQLANEVRRVTGTTWEDYA